jgi:hypothetical protein
VTNDFSMYNSEQREQKRGILWSDIVKFD